jgi:hypothetical protein
MTAQIRERVADPAQAFIAIALAIDRHRPGYIDSCYLSPEIRERAARNWDAANIQRACDELLAHIAQQRELHPARRAYLAEQVRAMQHRVSMPADGHETLAEEARMLLDVAPRWIDESEFRADRAVIKDLLPRSDGDLVERLESYRAAASVQLAPGVPVFVEILAELRRRTAAAFGLPKAESLSISFYDDRSSLGYHRYLGEFRSQVDIHSGQSLDIPGLIRLLAHEAYPGHHTELALKEAALSRGQGWLEHGLTIVDAPACVVSEGIAVRGLSALMREDELIHWCAELMASCGQDPGEAARRVTIENARQRLRSIAGNAALLLEDTRGDENEVARYVRRYGLADTREAARVVRFVQDVRCYIFTYRHGGQLVDELFAVCRDRQAAFSRLLREPFTPSRIRAWVTHGEAHDAGFGQVAP